MAKVYLETSFVSYLVARRSRDLIVAATATVDQRLVGKPTGQSRSFHL